MLTEEEERVSGAAEKQSSDKGGEGQKERVMRRIS